MTGANHGKVAGGRIIPAKLISLENAPWAFAPPRLRNERFRAAERADEAAKSSKWGSKPTSGKAAETFESFAKGLGEIVEDLRIRSAPELAMRQHLLKKLREGKLEACGVQFAPKQKSQLESIPEHFFVDAKINWNGNKVTNFGVTYTAVRVQRPVAREAAPKAIGEGPLPSGVRGRPSKTPEVERAIDHLLEKGVALAKIPRPAAYKAVRKAANELKYNTEIGFSDPVVQRALSRRFDPRR
jgi:hypothetical protein